MSHFFQREQIKDKDSLNKVETTNQRMSDDIRGLLMSLQSDYSQRLYNFLINFS